jgi:hypothetical protein
MKSKLILTGSLLVSALTSHALELVFTDANAFEATVDVGTLGSIIEPADGSTLTTLSYTVSGLTIDDDGVLNDTITLTIAVSASSSEDNIIWDTNGGGTREFDINGGTFNEAGEGVTFGVISVSGTSSSGQSYVLNSALYTEVSYRRFSNNGADNVDTSSIVGSSTNIASNTDSVVALNDTYFTTEWVAGSWNLQSVDFTVDVVALPEPNAYALLAGLTGLACVLLRRRRS